MEMEHRRRGKADERIGEPRNPTNLSGFSANPPTHDEPGDNADERIGEYQIGEIPRFGAKAPTHDELMGYPKQPIWLIRHGGWGDWLAAEDIAERTARRLMELAKRAPELCQIGTFGTGNGLTGWRGRVCRGQRPSDSCVSPKSKSVKLSVLGRWTKLLRFKSEFGWGIGQ